MKFFKKIVVALLILESRIIIAKYKPYIIAVTGSVGKTSTKDAIFSVLHGSGLCKADGTGICYVRKSEKSLNSDIGLPLTVIGVPNAWRSMRGWMRNLLKGLGLIFRKQEYPDCLVLEVGADHPNDIRSMTKWLRPDISVITQVSSTPVHVEFFDSPEEVFEEKASLATAVKKGGTLILFADNPKVLSLAERVKDKGIKVISFGTVENSNVRGAAVTFSYNELKIVSGFTFDITIAGITSKVNVLRLIGKSYLYPLLAAAAVGLAKEIPLPEIIEGLKRYEAPKGRMNIIPGANGATLIDDTYNSSPDAAVSAIQTIKEAECAGSKIAALGDMLELGQYAAEEHRKIGKEVVGVANMLVTVGQRSRATADEAVKNGFVVENVKSFDTSIEAAEFLQSIVKTGDLVLVKGSQSIRMERVVKALMKNPEEAPKLLVRQEKEWLEKK